jgi:hypothetical protein
VEENLLDILRGTSRTASDIEVGARSASEELLHRGVVTRLERSQYSLRHATYRLCGSALCGIESYDSYIDSYRVSTVRIKTQLLPRSHLQPRSHRAQQHEVHGYARRATRRESVDSVDGGAGRRLSVVLRRCCRSACSQRSTQSTPATALYKPLERRGNHDARGACRLRWHQWNGAARHQRGYEHHACFMFKGAGTERVGVGEGGGGEAAGFWESTSTAE